MEDYKLIDNAYIKSIAPVRIDEGHKGTFGTGLLIAGSKYMTGALVLSAESALRSGAGIIRAFSEDEALMPLKINLPCAVTSSYEDTLPKTLKVLAGYVSKSRATGIGSGIDVNNKFNKAILECVIKTSDKLVVDASALELISKDKDYFFPLLKARVESNMSPAILTPHIGEFSKLTGLNLHGKTVDELQKLAVSFSRDLGVVLVLKSSTVYIADCGSSARMYIGNNSGMAKGGSGDVLMGLILGLLTQGFNPYDASCAATYFHQEAGHKAAAELGKRAMLPSDLTKFYGLVFDESGW